MRGSICVAIVGQRSVRVGLLSVRADVRDVRPRHGRERPARRARLGLRGVPAPPTDQWGRRRRRGRDLDRRQDVGRGLEGTSGAEAGGRAVAGGQRLVEGLVDRRGQGGELGEGGDVLVVGGLEAGLDQVVEVRHLDLAVGLVGPSAVGDRQVDRLPLLGVADEVVEVPQPLLGHLQPLAVERLARQQARGRELAEDHLGPRPVVPLDVDLTEQVQVPLADVVDQVDDAGGVGVARLEPDVDVDAADRRVALGERQEVTLAEVVAVLLAGVEDQVVAEVLLGDLLVADEADVADRVHWPFGDHVGQIVPPQAASVADDVRAVAFEVADRLVRLDDLPLVFLGGSLGCIARRRGRGSAAGTGSWSSGSRR